MTTTLTVIDRIKSNHNITSDYAVAKLLGVSRQSVSYYRSKGSQFDDTTALRAAKLADIDPYKLLASLHSEKAVTDDSAEFWKDLKNTRETLKSLKDMDYQQAIHALLNGTATNKQKDLVKRVSQQCILCKIGNIRKTATFSPIYQNIPKKHLN
jgi:predicted transcriptional regulator